MTDAGPAPGAATVVFLMGPTAAGKTAAAVALTEAYDVSLVSVDSAMVFRDMDIGTGKPPPEVLARAPHALVDIRSPEEPYSAAEFAADAAREIAAIEAAGRRAVLVGGTGLYFRALERGLAELPGADAAVRTAIAARAARAGWPALHARLARVDPASAARIEPADGQRVQRALEVYELTGQPMSALIGAAPPRRPRYRVHRVVLEPLDRASLHRRIESRFDRMLGDGLVEEVRRLRERYRLHAELPSMRAVGYRQIWRHLEGEWDLDTTRARALAATRQLAKRQITWLRRECGADRIDSESADARARVVARLRPLLAA